MIPRARARLIKEEQWIRRLEAARMGYTGSAVAVFKGRSRADVDAQIAQAKRDRRIGDLTDIAAIIDPYPPIEPTRLRPEPGSSVVKGFPDEPDNPLNFHPAHRKELITPPPLLTPETIRRVTYFRFTPQWFQVSLWRFLTNGGRRACVVWHRRAGKDELAMAFLARMMLLEPGSYWILYPTITQAKNVLWSMRVGDEARIDRIFPRAFRRRTRDSDLFIEFLNGSRLQFVGSDNFDDLRGASVRGVVFSEYATALPEAWPTLRPMIDQNNGIVIFISTPRGKNHFHDIYETARASPLWFAERRGVNETDIYDNGQLEAALEELTKVYGKAQGEAFFDAEYGASFTAAVPGAFYSGELKHLEAEGRIRALEIDKSVPVDTAWDLGRTDSTAVWFIQRVGREYRLVDYYESSGVAVHHYVEMLNDKKYLHKWRYGTHYFPHDIKQSEWLSEKSRVETLVSLGIEPVIAPDHRILDGINAVRRMLDRTFIDPDRCARGLEALRNYVREWSIELRDWRASAKHDWASHGADSLRVFAMAHEECSFKPSSDRSRSWSSAPPTSSHWAA
jgi:hypothetical protein